MNPIRVGLAGAGPGAEKAYAPMLAAGPETTLAGVWSRREEATRALAERHGAKALPTFERCSSAARRWRSPCRPTCRPSWRRRRRERQAPAARQAARARPRRRAAAHRRGARIRRRHPAHAHAPLSPAHRGVPRARAGVRDHGRAAGVPLGRVARGTLRDGVAPRARRAARSGAARARHRRGGRGPDRSSWDAAIRARGCRSRASTSAAR
jgi:hypothetical protein